MAAANAHLQPRPLPHTSCSPQPPFSAPSPGKPHLPRRSSGRVPCASASLAPLPPCAVASRVGALSRLQGEALRSRVRVAWTRSGAGIGAGVGSTSSTRAAANRARSCTAWASAAAGPSAGSSSSMSSVGSVSIVQPDDWHLHLRDGADMESVVGFSAAVFKRAIIMPNLRPPITTTAAAVAYRERILNVLARHPPVAGSSTSGGGVVFEPLMTLYLTDATSPDEIERAKASGVVHALKLYPAGATTNSEAGVTDLLGRCIPTLEKMAQLGLPLLVHGEVVDPDVDFFDREKVFIQRVLTPLLERVPDLRVVMEHITTADAAEFVLNFPQDDRLAATVTPQHLMWNRNALFVGGLRPHHFCLPVLKRETHRAAVLRAATSGSKRFFLGTDSAPHERRTKEAPCGCAGVFSAHAALALYATAFDQAGALDKLEAFASFNGPDFYRLPRNTSRVTLARQPWVVPDSYPYGSGGKDADGGAPTAVVPMMAGEEVQWTVAVCSD